LATGRDLVQAALRKIGVVSAGESMEADEAADAIAEVNRMLGTWNAQGLMIHAHAIARHTLVTDQESYTIGPGSADFDTARPEKIVRANLFDPAGEYIAAELHLRDVYWWADRRPAFETSSLPRDLFYNPAAPGGTLHLSPAPDRAYLLELTTWGLLTALGLDTDVALPPGYEDAMVLTAAERLAPEYGASAPASVSSQASDARAWLKSRNLRTPPVVPDYAAGGRYDARSGSER
jgi:hypothetical protein